MFSGQIIVYCNCRQQEAKETKQKGEKIRSFICNITVRLLLSHDPPLSDRIPKSRIIYQLSAIFDTSSFNGHLFDVASIVFFFTFVKLSANYLFKQNGDR